MVTYRLKNVAGTIDIIIETSLPNGSDGDFQVNHVEGLTKALTASTGIVIPLTVMTFAELQAFADSNYLLIERYEGIGRNPTEEGGGDGRMTAYDKTYHIEWDGEDINEEPETAGSFLPITATLVSGTFKNAVFVLNTHYTITGTPLIAPLGAAPKGNGKGGGQPPAPLAPGAVLVVTRVDATHVTIDVTGKSPTDPADDRDGIIITFLEAAFDSATYPIVGYEKTFNVKCVTQYTLVFDGTIEEASPYDSGIVDVTEKILVEDDNANTVFAVGTFEEDVHFTIEDKPAGLLFTSVVSNGDRITFTPGGTLDEHGEDTVTMVIHLLQPAFADGISIRQIVNPSSDPLNVNTHTTTTTTSTTTPTTTTTTTTSTSSTTTTTTTTTTPTTE